MQDYKSNSHRSKQNEVNEREKHIAPVTSGRIQNEPTRHNNWLTKIVDMFFYRDFESIGAYILNDILVPSVKKAIYEIGTNGLDMLVYGSDGRNKANVPASNVAYNGFFNRQRNTISATTNNQRVSTTDFTYQTIPFDTRGEAEEVLAGMMDILYQSNYPSVSIADMYDLAGRSCPHTYNNYGWTDISNATTSRTRDGFYVINLPRAEPLM